MQMFKNITRNVWILSIVSLSTDVASEMLYPVMPVYLRSIGFSIVLIGVLEGFAEAIAGLSKGYFGKVSDARQIRLPFVRAGYALSAVSKPLMAFFIYPLWIFFVRTIDRLGKGIRTGARDALLSDETTSKYKGQVFGFHRSMDTLGAVLGPLLALVYLHFHPARYRPLFLLAFFPGILAVLFTFFIKEKKKEYAISVIKPGFLDFLLYWRQSPAMYRKLVSGLLVFTLFNSSDVFLLLKIKQAGFSDTTVISTYIFYNLTYAIFSYPIGILADKIGMKRIFITGLILFAAVYAGMAVAQSNPFFIVLFFLYGIYAAATEGIAKAWITNINDKKNTATAIGTYTAFQSIATMLASSLTGIIWFSFGASIAFALSSAATIGVAVYLSICIKNTIE